MSASSSQLLVASGGSAIKVYDTRQFDFPLVQTLADAHPLGCHHLAVDSEGRAAASIGFGGGVKIWRMEGDLGWQFDRDLKSAHPKLPPAQHSGAEELTGGRKAGELWALTISKDGGIVGCTTAAGKVIVWRLDDTKQSEPIELHTKGNFGSSISIVRFPVSPSMNMY